MAPSENKGPALSEGLLRHLGIDAKLPQGNGGKRSRIQSRKDDRKQARSKSHGTSYQRPRNQQQVPKHIKRSAFDNDRDGRPPKRKVHERHATPQKEESSSRHSSNGDFAGVQDLEDSSDGSDRPGGDPSYLDGDADDSNDYSDGDEGDDDEGDDGEEDDEGDNGDGHGCGHGNTNTGGITSKVPARVREKLAQDDAEIAELERKLGIKGRKSLPKAFKDDGLGELLDGVQDNAAEIADAVQKKKRKAEADEWLRLKRRKAERSDGNAILPDKSASEGEDDSDAGDDVGDDSTAFKKQTNRQRENPYKAPVSAAPTPQKYIPPALRKSEQVLNAESEVISRVQKQAHHLVARLSDANMLSILGEVDKLYMDYPRQHVTSAVVAKLLEQIEIEGALSSNVTILIAGFATAVYTAKGTDFGAHFIQQNATHFREHYNALTEAGAVDALEALRDQHHSWAPTSKIALNLFTLMAELYNFRMIGSSLIYDYIRMLLDHITEFNAELLVRVFEVSGHRLRQDDPGALKGVVSLIQPAVVRAGGYKSLSVRTRHMIDQISNLKKSDKKKHRDAESSGFGHADRMRKLLGTLPTSRKIEAAGPLHVSLVDLEQADRRGKWWLVGASWAGSGRSLDEPSTGAGNGQNNNPAAGGSGSEQSGQNPTQNARARKDQNKDNGRDGGDDVLGSWANDVPDMEELNLLAREQGMNTDARRSIFVALLSAADSKDAHARLLRLGLNKHQKREIANVLIRCVGSEQNYNRYYALVARHVCSADRRMDWVFQASLWKLFRRLGEPIFGEAQDDDAADEEDEATDLRRVVNTAKMYGYLVACGSISLGVLKCLSLAQLQLKTRMFVEVLLLALFDEARQADKESSNVLVKKRFAFAIRNNEDLRRGLQYFVEKVVRKSKLVGKSQASGVARLCDAAQRALAEAGDA